MGAIPADQGTGDSFNNSGEECLIWLDIGLRFVNDESGWAHYV